MEWYGGFTWLQMYRHFTPHIIHSLHVACTSSSVIRADEPCFVSKKCVIVNSNVIK